MKNKVNFKNVIVVACPAGRVGSSSVMGVLDKFGYMPGRPDGLIGSGGMNPKGFFELKSQDRFIGKVFRGYYPGPTKPPELNYVIERCNRYFRDFKSYLRSEFEDDQAVAIKAPRWLPLPFYKLLSYECDVRVISLTRDVEKQVSSTYRVWQQTCDPLLVNVSHDQIKKWVMSWQDFAEQMNAYINSPSLTYNLSFDSLISNPVNEVGLLANWLEIPSFENDVILEWFDKSLVDREALPELSRFEMTRRRVKRSLQNIIRKPYIQYSPYILSKEYSDKS